MKKNLFFLALLLLVCLVGAGLLALTLDSAEATPSDSTTVSAGAIVISEICTKNETIFADNDGKFRDYIELHNSGVPVNLAGFTLTDGKATSEPFGDIILDTGEYRVFFLGDTVTGFALGAAGGDCIQLLDGAGNIVAQANTAASQTDQVLLFRSGVYKQSFDASPGFSNDAEGVAAFREGQPAQDPAIQISELLIGNESSLPDENGVFSDIVELHNNSGSDVVLSRYFLSDDMQQRFQYRLPDRVLGAGEYLVIYCDGENYIGPNGEIHTNFGLAHGETLVLTDNSGTYVSLEVEFLGDDVSVSLLEDGTYSSGYASLGFSNDETGIAMFEQSRVNIESALVISEVLLSSAGVPYEGAFCDVVEICNRSEVTVSTANWYLSDGGDPFEYPLPKQTLKPGECIVIRCSPQTTGFALSEGEILRLTGPDFRHAPLVSCVSPEQGMSISLQGDGEDGAYSFSAVTLGYANDPQNYENYLADQMSDGLRISEMMSANRSYLKGPYSTTCDWIEFYNTSDSEINLGEYCITDNKGNLGKYALPDVVLQPGKYCVILLADDPTNLLKGYQYLSMTLSSEGETLYLSKNGTIVDHVFLPSMPTDYSYGRGDNCITFSMLGSVTPGRQNGSAAEMTAAPVAVTPQGSYDDVEYVDVVLSGEGDIYYTTNCYAPTENSKLYTGPIRLTKTTVLRVFCRQEGKLKSEVVDFTYLINEYDTLPAVSLVTSPDNLWNINYGIYVLGNNAQEEEPHRGANYWMDWEKPATLSLFETDGGGFSVNCGIKIFGGFTRVLDKKSLACFFRDNYGDSELKYPLFGEDGLDTFESIVLRTSGQDAFTAKMRDVVITSLVGEYTDVPVQDYKPVVVYLNGEYWGLHYIREKLNENYLAGHYNAEPEEMTVVKLGGWTCQEYRDLVAYAATHDMTVQEHYDYVCSQIDVDNYIDFFIAEMWVANTDNGNVKYFVSPEGKWTWMLYDTDISFGDSSMDRVAHNLSNSWIGSADITCKTFAVKLMANEEFRDKFLTRLAWQMNTIWTEENVIGRIDEIASMIDGDMEKEARRWRSSYAYWASCVEHLRQFARERNGYMLQHIQDYFNLTDSQLRAYGFQV